MSAPELKPLSRSLWVSLTLTLGLLLVFVGERLLVSGSARGVASVGGVALVLAAVVWRILRSLRAGPGRASVERSLLALSGLAVLGLIAYALTSDLLPVPLREGAPKLDTMLRVLGPALFLLALLPTWLTEAAYAAMVRAPIVEVNRTRDALRTGLGFGFVLVFAFSAVYVASERDVSHDFAYFRATRPSESTLKLVESLNAPLEVTLFYPPGNEVHEKLRSYFGDLASRNPLLSVATVDQAVDPLRARELGVNVNGYVVLQRESRKELFSLSTDISRVRGALKTLDGEIQKRLLTLVKARRVVYLVGGHGEIADTQPNKNDGRPTVSILKDGLKTLNAEVRMLTAANGLLQEVPKDATAVLLLGPTHALMAEEREALLSYARTGGKLWIALEPGTPEAELLLNPLALELGAAALAHEREFVPQTRQLSDRANLVTASYSSHPSVSALARMGTSAPIAFLGAAPIKELARIPPEVTNLNLVVKASAGTFEDLDGDFTKGEKEPTESYGLVAAVELKGGGRVFVQGDVDALGDTLLRRVPTHRAFFLDGMRWLVGDESLVGGVSSEEDVAVVHTRKEDVWWFYGSVFLAPALVLGFGFVLTNRRARKARPGQKGSAEEKV